MKRNLKKIILITIIFLIIIFLTIPMLEIKTENKLYIIRYKENTDEFETNSCYNESYFYNKKHNISLSNFKHKNFLFIHIHSFDYKEGNICKTEYQLEEEYIQNIISNATITSNPNNINLKTLIEGKTPIVGNTKYLGNDYTLSMDYILEEKEETLFVFYKYELLIIQIGHSDEGPKYIAYK